MEKSETVLAKDLMNEGVRSVTKDKTVREVAKMMKQEGIGSVVVIDQAKPVGIITERDFVIKVAADNSPLDESVSGIMSSPVVFVNEFQTIKEVVEIMSKNNVRRIPVIQDDLVLGIITSRDLIHLFSTSTDEEFTKIYQQYLLKIFPEV